MNTDVAPTPWRISGTSILDAQDRLVVLAACRLVDYPEILAEIAAAPEMRKALEVCGHHLAYSLLRHHGRERQPTMLEIGLALVDATHALSSAAVILSNAVSNDTNPLVAARRALADLSPAFAQIAGAILDLENIPTKKHPQ